MTALIVLGIIILLLVLLAFLRVGVRAIYGAEGPVVKLRLGLLRLTFFPQNPKKAEKKRVKTKKKKKEKVKAESPEQEKKAGGLKGLMELLPAIRETLSRFRRKLRVDLLVLRVTVPGAEDPAKAALQFGRGNAAMGALLPMLENMVDVRRRELQTEIDYTASELEVYAEAELTLAVWHVFYIAFGFLGPFLRLRKNKKSSAADTNTQKRKRNAQDNSNSERPVSK